MSAVPRFAHVFATFGRGGPQVRAVQLLARLGGAARHVVVAMDGCLDARELLPAGLDVAFAPPPPRGGLLATVRRQRDWLAGLRPELVLTYNWGAIETVAAARSLRLPRVHHEDGFGPGEATRRLRRRNWLRRYLLRGAPVVVPSQVLQRIAAAEWGVPAPQLHCLPNGVDLQRFHPDPGPRPPGPLRLLAVGGLRAEKDHAALLQALAALPEATLQLAGDGPLRAALAAQATALGLAARVDFDGAIADPAPLYRQADLFVLPSRTEQMPLSLLEAMASGLPVVATDVGDVRAMLPAAQAPFVVPPGQPQALAVACRTLLADAAQRTALGAANRARAAERYEAGACLDRFLAVYTAALRS